MKKYLLFSLLFIPTLSLAYSDQDVSEKADEIRSLIVNVRMNYPEYKRNTQKLDDKMDEMVYHCAEYHKSAFMRESCNKLIESRENIIGRD